LRLLPEQRIEALDWILALPPRSGAETDAAMPPRSSRGRAFTLRVFIAGKERCAIPIDPDRFEDAVATSNVAVADLLDSNSVAVFVDDGNVLHFIGGAR
jgi:hypothetical protein